MKRSVFIVSGVILLLSIGIVVGAGRFFAKKPQPTVAGVTTNAKPNEPSSGGEGFGPFLKKSVDSTASPIVIGPQLSPAPVASPNHQPTASPQPRRASSPTPQPTGTPQPKPSVDPLLTSLPHELHAIPEILPVVKGGISFTVKADWGEADRELMWGNFNGRDIKNLFQIVGSGSLLVSDIRDANANVINGECNVDIPDTVSGKDYTIKISWDFEASPWVQKVYIDNELKRECPATLKPDDLGGKIYTGTISGFTIL